MVVSLYRISAQFPQNIVRWGVVALLAMASTSCKRPDGLYCESDGDCTDPQRSFCDTSGVFTASNGVGRTCIADPNVAPSVDGGPNVADAGGIDARIDCTKSEECSDSLPICRDTMCSACNAGAEGNAECLERDPNEPLCQSGGCVECIANSDCQGTEPICDTNGNCSACQLNSECASGACETPTGRCVATSAIVYVDFGEGNNAKVCGNAPGVDACKLLGDIDGAVSHYLNDVTKTHIVMAPGNHNESIFLNAVDVIVVGQNTTIRPPSGPGISVGTSSVTLHDLTITGSAFEGIECLGESVLEIVGNVVVANEVGIQNNGCKLRIENSEVAKNVRDGVVSHAEGSLTIVDSTVSENGDRGVVVGDSPTRIIRSSIVENRLGGVSISSSVFHLESSVFARNGNTQNDDGFLQGGIAVGGFFGTEREILHCTIVDNLDPAGGFAEAAGVQCGGGEEANAVRINSSIIVNNVLDDSNEQINGNCDLRFSMTPGSTANGNSTASPTFVGVEDYHLAAGSAGIDIADPASTVSTDIDGDPRPSGPGYDMGADER